jgi:hypothetical protein
MRKREIEAGSNLLPRSRGLLRLKVLERRVQEPQQSRVTFKSVGDTRRGMDRSAAEII